MNGKLTSASSVNNIPRKVGMSPAGYPDLAVCCYLDDFGMGGNQNSVGDG